MPFDLRLATTGGGPRAALTNEDGVRLAVALADINGTAPAATTGHVSDSAVTYVAPVTSAPSDVAMRATLSGLDVSVTLHSAQEANTFGVMLTLDPRAQVVQDSDGTIRITRPITDWGGSGETHPGVTLQPEFIVETPAVADAGRPLATVGPATLVLTSVNGSQQRVSVRIDPAWLSASQRVFPVRVDLPVVTAYSAVHTGLFSTANSCAPTTGTRGDVLVGAVGGCIDAGVLSFDTTSLLYDTPIVSAMLHLYAPGRSGPSDVRVYPNAAPGGAPVSQPAAWLPPTWQTRPQVAPGASGIAPGSSSGAWQSWDVTNLVRQWVRQPASNGGLTLMGTTPTLFVSTLGVAEHGPALAPYLEILYAPRPAISPDYSDGAGSIMGVSGTFATCAAVQCTTGGPISVWASGPVGVAGNYIRVGAVMDCNGGMPTAASGNGDTLYNILYGATYSAYREGVIPIVNFVPNNNCDGLSPSLWNQGVKTFVANMGYPKTSWIYFEIGNEPNTTGGDTSHGGCNSAYGQYPNCNAKGFEDTFAAAAQGLRDAMGDSRTNYRILTGGMAQPTAYVSFQGSCTDLHNNVNVNDAGNAISEAEGAPYSVNASHLGVAVHPYKYNTNETSGNPQYWRNYFHEYGGSSGNRGYGGICGDIGGMISLWTSDFSGMPVIFTEDNWSDHPTIAPDAPYCGNYTGCAGTYLVDLKAWLHGHGGGYDNASSSPIRVAWFTGINFTGPPPAQESFPLGLYNSSGGVQAFNTGYCPNNSNVAGYKNLSDDYRNLIIYGSCY